MESIQSFISDLSSESSDSPTVEWILMITLQTLILTAVLSGTKRYLNSVCNTPDQEDILPFIKNSLAVLEYLDSIEAHCISWIQRSLVFCFRSLRSRLFDTLSEFSHSLDSPPPRVRGSTPPLPESPESRDKRRMLDIVRKLMVEEGTREFTLRSGTVSSSWKLTRSTVKMASENSDENTNNRNPALEFQAESSSENVPKPPQPNDWYSYWIRQRQARVPEVVERYGRPRTLLQGSNIPASMRLHKSAKYSKPVPKSAQI